MKLHPTDNPSDPARQVMRDASDRYSRETLEEPPAETFGVEMFMAKQAVDRAIDEFGQLDLPPCVGGRLLAAIQDAQLRLELAVKLYDAWRPSDWGLEARL